MQPKVAALPPYELKKILFYGEICSSLVNNTKNSLTYLAGIYHLLLYLMDNKSMSFHDTWWNPQRESWPHISHISKSLGHYLAQCSLGRLVLPSVFLIFLLLSCFFTYQWLPGEVLPPDYQLWSNVFTFKWSCFITMWLSFIVWMVIISVKIWRIWWEMPTIYFELYLSSRVENLK